VLRSSAPPAKSRRVAAASRAPARKAAVAFGWNQQTTAKAEARVWSVTMLPAVTLSAVARYKLDRRGVHLSRLRANLDDIGR
jgi:hypothetical protein